MMTVKQAANSKNVTSDCKKYSLLNGGRFLFMYDQHLAKNIVEYAWMVFLNIRLQQAHQTKSRNTTVISFFFVC